MGYLTDTTPQQTDKAEFIAKSIGLSSDAHRMYGKGKWSYDLAMRRAEQSWRNHQNSAICEACTDCPATCEAELTT